MGIRVALPRVASTWGLGGMNMYRVRIAKALLQVAGVAGNTSPGKVKETLSQHHGPPLGLGCRVYGLGF